jgi:[acyl-carrier-protein] S-malonyltransferase
MKAYIFPGQGSQFTGMGLDLFENHPAAKALFERADVIMNFSISEIMFRGTDEQLRQTNVTQPSIFIHSVIHALIMGDRFVPDMVAGHSLGEFSALTAAGALSFEDGLRLVMERAEAMQDACAAVPGTMAAILGLEDAIVENICSETPGIVVPANYNCPGQLVISGELEAVKAACEKMTAAGAKRALLLPVGGAFHSPLMEPARTRLAAAIEKTMFNQPRCAIYQNVTARPHRHAEEIRKNLIAQLTAPVRWTQTVEHMAADGASSFTEVGPGKVLQGLVRKIHREAEIVPA